MTKAIIVILNEMCGNKATAEIVTAHLGKKIKTLEINKNDRLVFTFTDGDVMALFDDGQSCCEVRYMHTDDNLGYFIGGLFTGARISEGNHEDIKDQWDEVKESQFLIISTSKGEFTIVNYNEHNGYYGGFSIKATQEKQDEA